MSMTNKNHYDITLNSKIEVQIQITKVEIMKKSQL